MDTPPHTRFQRGEFRETDLAEAHSPTIATMVGLERRPSFWYLIFYGETLINSFRRGFLFI
jgi:hypothetical protein